MQKWGRFFCGPSGKTTMEWADTFSKHINLGKRAVGRRNTANLQRAADSRNADRADKKANGSDSTHRNCPVVFLSLPYCDPLHR